MAAYETTIASISGNGIIDEEGNTLFLMNYMPLHQGDTVLTDGRFIYGYAQRGEMPPIIAVTKSVKGLYIPALIINNDSWELYGVRLEDNSLQSFGSGKKIAQNTPGANYVISSSNTIYNLDGLNLISSDSNGQQYSADLLDACIDDEGNYLQAFRCYSNEYVPPYFNNNSYGFSPSGVQEYAAIFKNGELQGDLKYYAFMNSYGEAMNHDWRQPLKKWSLYDIRLEDLWMQTDMRIVYDVSWTMKGTDASGRSYTEYYRGAWFTEPVNIHKMNIKIRGKYDMVYTDYNYGETKEYSYGDYKTSRSIKDIYEYTPEKGESRYYLVDAHGDLTELTESNIKADDNGRIRIIGGVSFRIGECEAKLLKKAGATLQGG